jgi:hypothetical protein
LSEDQAFVSNIFTRLNILTDKYTIQMIGRPSWRKFDNIDVSYLHSLNYLLLTNEYIDYSDNKVKSFIEKYRTLYNQEPSKYAFAAYDLTYNFGKYFYQWEALSCMKNFQFESLMMGFEMTSEGCCWINKNLFVIHYNEAFDVEKVEY